MEKEGVEQRLPVDLKKLLGRPRISAFDGNSRDLRDWLATLDKSCIVYGLMDLAYDATRWKASEFVNGLLARWPSLRMKTPGELGMSREAGCVAFPRRSKRQHGDAGPVGRFVCICHNVIKEGPLRLSVAVVLTKESQGVWEKVRGRKAQEQCREVGRKGEGKRTPTWSRRVKQEVEEPEVWEEDPKKRLGQQGMCFLSPSSGRISLLDMWVQEPQSSGLSDEVGIAPRF